MSACSFHSVKLCIALFPESRPWFPLYFWSSTFLIIFIKRNSLLQMAVPQARTLEWAAISFSRGSSQPRDWSRVSCIADRHFILWATLQDRPSRKTVNVCSFAFLKSAKWTNRNKNIWEKNKEQSNSHYKLKRITRNWINGEYLSYSIEFESTNSGYFP